jgi:hypothetical protein
MLTYEHRSADCRPHFFESGDVDDAKEAWSRRMRTTMTTDRRRRDEIRAPGQSVRATPTRGRKLWAR